MTTALLQAQLTSRDEMIAALNADLDRLRLAKGIVEERFESLRRKLAEAERELHLARFAIVRMEMERAETPTAKALGRLRAEGLL